MVVWDTEIKVWGGHEYKKFIYRAVSVWTTAVDLIGSAIPNVMRLNGIHSVEQIYTELFIFQRHQKPTKKLGFWVLLVVKKQWFISHILTGPVP